MSIVISGRGEFDSQLHNDDKGGYQFGFGMYHAMANKKLYEPQRTTDFELVIPGLEGMINIGTGTPIMNSEETLRLAVASCSIPHYSVAVQTQRRGNSVVKYAGTASFEAGSVSIRDWIGADSKMALYSWMHQAYDVYTDKTGLLEDYKRDGCTLIELTPDKQVVRSWTLYGCWISDMKEKEWSHDDENSERLVEATLQFDKAEVGREYIQEAVTTTQNGPRANGGR